MAELTTLVSSVTEIFTGSNFVSLSACRLPSAVMELDWSHLERKCAVDSDDNGVSSQGASTRAGGVALSSLPEGDYSSAAGVCSSVFSPCLIPCAGVAGGGGVVPWGAEREHLGRVRFAPGVREKWGQPSSRKAVSNLPWFRRGVESGRRVWVTSRVLVVALHTRRSGVACGVGLSASVVRLSRSVAASTPRRRRRRGRLHEERSIWQGSKEVKRIYLMGIMHHRHTRG